MLNDYNKSNKLIKRELIWSVVILTLFSIPVHFLYDITGEIKIIGAIFPVNESVFEHLKLIIVPLVLWWGIIYFRLKNKIELDYRKWIYSEMFSIIISPFIMISFYYTYTGALGIESLVLDIISLIVALSIGQLVAYTTYKNVKITNEKYYLGIILIVLMLFAVVWFTFSPIEIPLFRDNVTGKYGI